ncbi:DNA polymerase-3 subunit alpha [Persephonella hydrogeniphila]|uniref:DNA polymerase III subunit alpha n=1 Tax=Persephonella hydrogeniphila TaxID=198703 RepID=A0A285N0F2_9AQUI|nr:DNA polymerase III subunit alpha [Persephonella hydrogeniphila]SNZ02935.1 DNA polymerase-3 subunit alpha [Persephonella hydrogeniphila]
MSRDFVHLHLHTHYSLLDGAIKIPELAQKAVEYGYKAVGMTDHGNIFGAVQFYQEMKKVGIKPIIGMEAYFTSNRFEKKGEGSDDILSDKNYHLILHAKDKTGFKNLMKLSSLAYTEGFYYKPRIDWELLERYHEGLICQTACLKGFVPHLLAQGKFDEAYQQAKRLKDIFGEDLYFEIQINGLPEQEEANKGIIELAKKLGVKIVATNDSHYLNPEDQKAHDVIKALQMKLTLKQLKEKGRAFKVGGLHFTRPEEMYEKFKGYEEALKNTVEIAEKCNVEIETADTRGYLFPKYQIPGLEREATQEEKAEYFEKLAWEGLEKRLSEKKELSKKQIEEYKERLRYEIDVIKQMGFPEYFLIVQDFINHAKKNGIPVGPGRGSAAGSLVAYTLGITDVDPLQHGLIFERFLNPDRISMPDIDVDFCMENRPKIIEYVKEKYGEQSVAQIITYNFMKSKMVIRDVARVLGFSYAEADKIAKMILPGPVQGSTLSIEENLEANPEFRKLYETDDRVRELIELAKKLEGMARHTGIHAAGVVIAPGPLDEYVPVYVDKDGTKATQFDMNTLEMLGLVKMDFLGLKTLTELDYMKKLVKERHGVDIDFLKLPIDDPNVYRLLQSGKTTGVFQLESKGMQNLLTRLKPDKFDEVIAILALFRPGPLMSGMVDDFIDRKHGRKPVEYPFEEVKDILEETYGLCLTGDTLVTLSDGSKKTIKEIVDKNLIGTEVLTVDIKTNKIIKSKISHCFDNGIKDVYKITLSNGLEIKATSDHKFLTPFGWKKVKDLSLNKDLLAIPINIDIEGKAYNENKLRVLAYLLADGHLGKSGICFVNKDKDLIEKFRRSVLSAFDNVKFSKYKRERNVWNVYVISEKRTSYNSNQLINWFKKLDLFHKNSEEKFIPDFIFTLNKESIAKFLAYYWDCDGYIGEKLCHIKTISKKLAYGLYSLLLRLGIKANIYKSIYGGKTAYQVTVYDLERFKKDILPYMTSSKKDRKIHSSKGNTYYSKKIVYEKVKTYCEENNVSQRKFSEKTGVQRNNFFSNAKEFISSQVLEKIAPVIEDEDIFRLLDGDIGFIPIKNIEYIGKEHVYDIEVEGTHNFIANDIISHNCIYQEQIMFIANILSGFTMAEADTLRKAIGKKKADVMAKMKDRFISGAVERGFDKNKIQKLWDDIEKFASYSFNKSHSTAYAYLTYWTAYIKTYYPEEFFAVKLSTEGNDDKFLNLLLDMEDFGIQLLPPDVNRSKAQFSIEEKGKIRFGLARIKNVGDQSARDIVIEREKNGLYRDIFDIAERLDSKKLNKRVLEALIKAGAFDFSGVDRGVMLASVDKALSSGQKAREQKASGQNSLLGLIETTDTQPVISYEKAEPLSEKKKLDFEKEVLGFYISGHPLRAYEKELKGYTTKINRLIERKTGDKVRIAGVIADVKKKKTRSGSTMAILTVQDETGIIDVRAFIDRMEDTSFLEENRIVVIEGSIEINEEQERVSMNASEITPIENINKQVNAVRFILSKEKALNGVATKIKEICEKYRGDKDVIIEIYEPGQFRCEIAANSSYSVSISDDFKQEISKILSPEEFHFE